MRNEPFGELGAALLRGGASRRCVARTLLELQDHYSDLEEAALAEGLPPNEAAARARERLGSNESIAAAVLARPELLAWNHRWPRVALWVRSAAAVAAVPVLIAALPAVPVVYCIDRSGELVRWSVSIALAGLVVGSLLAWLGWLSLLG